VDPQPAVEEEPAEIVEEPAVVDTQPTDDQPVVEEPTEIVEEEAPKLLKRQTKQNEFLLKKEKMEHDALLSAAPETDTFLYPTLDDPDFNYKISQREEFADTTYNGEIMDIRKQANILCNLPFELKPNQLFVRNFLSFQTPYNLNY
jgi:preprotein translocase subunit SecD